MATQAVPTHWFDSIFLQLASPSVNVTALSGELIAYLQAVGAVHRTLFTKALEITSGNDGKHVPGSAHYKWLAVDVRSLDLTDEQAAIFSLVLGYFSRLYKVAVFDERFTASPHWHIQTADSVGG